MLILLPAVICSRAAALWHPGGLLDINIMISSLGSAGGSRTDRGACAKESEEILIEEGENHISEQH